MLRKIVGVASMLLCSAQAWATTATAHPIEGIWLDQDKAGYILIARDADAMFQGRIAGSVTGSVDKDEKNPDPALRGESLLGQRIIKDLRCDADACHGSIYNPRDGRTYSARLRSLGPDVLEVRGYIGTPMLGQSQRWTRVKDESAPGLVALDP